MPSMGSIAGWHERLKSDLGALRYLHERGIVIETIKEHRIGWNGRSYTLPVFNGACSLANLRTYQPSGHPKMRGLRGRGTQLYPAGVLSPEIEHVVV